MSKKALGLTCAQRSEAGVFLSVEYIDGRPDLGMEFTLYSKDGRVKASHRLSEGSLCALKETLDKLLSVEKLPSKMLLFSEVEANDQDSKTRTTEKTATDV